MAALVLTRTLTYNHGGRLFRRGEPQEVADPGDYVYLLGRGFKDPDNELGFMHPSRLATVPPGTEVPVVRIGGLGDVLMASVAIREAAHRYPEIHFSYITYPAYAPLFRDCTSFLKRVVPVNELTGAYPWAIDLRGYAEREFRERLDRIGLFSTYLAGRHPEDWSFPLEPTAEERERGRRLAAMDGRCPTMVLALEANISNRMWPDTYVDRMCGLAHDRGWHVVLVAGRPHTTTPVMRAAGTLNLTGQLRVIDLMNVVAAADVVVAPDTGVAHLAEAVRTKSVVYFTTVPPEVRASHYSYMRTLYAGVPCGPCYHAPSCGVPIGTECARGVTPERVMEEVEWVAGHEPPYDYRAPLRADARRVRFAEAAA